MAKSKACGKTIGFFNGADTPVGRLCDACYNDRSAKLTTQGEEAIRDEDEARKNAIARLIVTTETQLDIVIRERLGIVTAEVAFGMNVFKDVFASIRNIVGGRSEAIQKTMRHSRETVLFELKKEAYDRGANAVIAVDIDYTQIGDSGWGMILVVATGTAVVLDETPSSE
jgi:uncharacterized protein YbjQ (UPF0145 family)